MRFSDLLHAKRRDAVADEGGFALIAVLAVIAFTGITIAALLGMMMTTLRVTGAQERTARERRAADGAIENAIEKMRTEQCDPAAQPFLADQVIGGVEVDIRCSSTPMASSSTDQVRLVGIEGYDGRFNAWRDDCASNAAVPGCLPWSDAGTSPGSSTPTDVSLVHSGPQALRFGSGITVRRGAVALRNPATGSPAIESGGEYNQGLPGIGGTGPTDCGLLSGAVGGGAGLIRDSSGAPSCGVAEAANSPVSASTAGSGLTPSNAPIILPTCSGPVVTFQPGIYSAAQTDGVNQLTGGGCTNRTFYFPPGVYSFRGGELRFGDAGSYYVFGLPSGWDPASGVQASSTVVNDPSSRLCNTEAPGSSIIVAGWTRLTHSGGRVAVCPASSTNDPTESAYAIYQDASAPTDVGVTIDRTVPSTRITHAFTCRGPNLFLGYLYPDNADINGSGECRPIRRYTLNLTTSGAARVDSLRVMLTGRESTPNNLVSQRQSRFTVYAANGSRVCETSPTSWATGMPNGGITSSFDLKRLGGSCATTTFDQSILDGGRIVVEHRLLRPPIGLDPTLTISDASVEVNAHTGRVQQASDVSSTQWSNPGAVAVADSSRSTAILPCPAGVCEVADPSGTRRPSEPFTHEMTLSNFQFPGLPNASTSGIDPAISSLRAVVKVAPSAGPLPPPADGIFLLPTSVFVELRSATGHRCVVQGQGMNSDQEIAVDLRSIDLETAAGPGCNSMQFDSVSDLNGVTMDVRFETPCVPDYSAPHYGAICLRNGTNVFQIRPPGIETVQLTATTNTFTETSTSSIVSDATAGAASASFNVYGMTWMPLTDLDIAWRGPATTQPVFANELVLNGLGSRMDPTAQMGTVCCDPPTSRTLEFTASIDGVDRMVSRVHFDDSVQTTPGRAQVDVLRWLNCGGACASVLAESDTRPNP